MKDEDKSKKLVADVGAQDPSVSSESNIETFNALAKSCSEAIAPITESQNALDNTEIRRLCKSISETMKLCKFDEMTKSISDSVKNLTSARDYTLIGNAISESMRNFSLTAAELTKSLENMKIEDCIKASEYVFMQDFVNSLANYSELTKLSYEAKERLRNSEGIICEPKDKEFFLNDNKDIKYGENEINIAVEYLRGFKDITISELISFTNELFSFPFYASNHPVSRKIETTVKDEINHTHLEDETIYYRARVKKPNDSFFTNKQMREAPDGCSNQGRYNYYGKGCFYATESEEAAINEVKKHCFDKQLDIQTQGYKKISDVTLLDLSNDDNDNIVLEHIRLQKENFDNKPDVNYLLSNFIAQCCEKNGIGGVKYKNGNYICIVLWNSESLSEVEGTENIIKVAEDESKNI